VVQVLLIQIQNLHAFRKLLLTTHEIPGVDMGRDPTGGLLYVVQGRSNGGDREIRMNSAHKKIRRR
jgi:hypothetical protein